MKIIIYSLNFKPELVGVGKYTGELADYLNDKGHTISVITSPKYYPEWQIEKNRYYLENLAGYKIYRCPLYVPKYPNGIKRLLHLITFSITSLPILLKHLRWKPDLIILVAPTLFCCPNIFIFRLLSLKKVLAILQVQDFELEAAFNLGILKGKIFKKFFTKLEIIFFRGFQAVGTISKAMEKKLHKKGLDKNRTFYFPNWVDLDNIQQKKFKDKYINKYRKKLKISPEIVIIQYSGSMNKKLGLNFLLPIIQYFKKYKNVLWLFGGDGPLKEDFIYSTRDILNIKFMSFQKSSELSEWLNTGDIHIIPQDEEVEELLLPSKLITILASGNPIVSNVNRKTEVGKIVDKAGIRVDPSDHIGFINALDYLIKNEKYRLDLGKKGRKIAKNKFCKELLLKKFNKFIEDLS